MYKIEVEWTGSYPTLCCGRWIIKVNDVLLSGVGDGDMNTRGTYSSWYFGEDWVEEWEEYSSGSHYLVWKDNMPNNLKMALRLAGFNPNDEELTSNLYRKLQENDWRSSSCGGCI